MLTLAGFILKAKAVFQFLVDIFIKVMAFLLKPRRVFLPLLIPVVICVAFYVLWGQRGDAIDKLAKHEAAAENARYERDAENRAKDASMKYIIEQTKLQHAGELDILKGQYDALDKQKRGADRTLADVRSRLSRQLEEAAYAIRLSCLPGGSLQPPESWPDGDSAYLGETITDADYIDKLELGCAITTADYNTLYERVEAANKIYGEFD